MIIKRIQKEIEDEYSKRQSQSKKATEERKIKIYKELPEIEQIDKAINSLCILKAYSVTKCNLPSSMKKSIPEKYITMNANELEREIVCLATKRANILNTAGYSDDYTENAFVCDICKDTGFINKHDKEELCACRSEMLAKKLKQASGASESDIFSKFKIDLYSEIPNAEKYGISVAPKVQMEAVYKRCIKFVNEFDDVNLHNMVFVGKSGLGKTFLGNCIINALTDKGVSCLYMPATALFKPFSVSLQNREEAEEIIEFIFNCGLLIIDDLGSEKQTATRYSEFLEILNTRALKNKKVPCKTIITTNLSPKEILDCYGERVMSRIFGEFDILQFAGDDIRLKRKSY